MEPSRYPQPIFILAAYDENGVPNAMNAAWDGVSDDKEISFCISAGHKTTHDILARKAFTVSLANGVQHLCQPIAPDTVFLNLSHFEAVSSI